MPAAYLKGSEVTVVAPDRPGLLWQAAGVLASHRLAVRSANATSRGAMAVASFTVAPEFGDPPDADLVSSDLRRALEGRLDVAERLERRMRAHRPSPVPVAPPKVTLVDDASRTATVVEVRAHDEPGLLVTRQRLAGIGKAVRRHGPERHRHHGATPRTRAVALKPSRRTGGSQTPSRSSSASGTPMNAVPNGNAAGCRC